MKSIHKYIAVVLIALSSFAANAQNDDIGSGLKNNFFTGGSMGLSFGNITNIEIAPVFGYHLSNIVSFGIGGDYQYLHYRDYSSSFSVYGGRFFMRIHPISQIFLHAEYSVLTYKTNIFNAPTYQMQNIINEGLLVGVGYREYLSDRVSTVIMLLYDLNYSMVTPYSNPSFRFGIEWTFPAKQ